MDVIFFPLELYKIRLKIYTDTLKNALQLLEDGFCEDIAAVFSHEDQVHVEEENTRSTSS